MGICWYCYWGWAKEVREIYDRALDDIGYDSPLEFGPSHIVWSDENFDTVSIEFCIKECDQNHSQYDLTADELARVRQSLTELLAIPEAVRCCQPVGYDGERPEAFPPPDGLAMTRK